MTLRPCLDCNRPAAGPRCRSCEIVNHAGYRRPAYLAQPMRGICHLCGLPGADTRDHLTPLALDPRSIATLPAHRSCNSARGASR